MPFGGGHSVEAQMTGKDAFGGIQIEVTPHKPRPAPHPLPPCSYTYEGPGDFRLFLKMLDGYTAIIMTYENDRVEVLKSRIYMHKKGQELEDGYILSDYGIPEDQTLQLTLRLRGGYAVRFHPHIYDMSIAAGGQIEQVIAKDTYNHEWLPEQTTVFNVQMLTSAAYKMVTGSAPPYKPIGAEEYAAHNMPFFKMYEEPSGVCGDFGAVKSVAQLDGVEKVVVEPRVVEIYKNYALVLRFTGLVNPMGPMLPFRTKNDLKK
ncbi:hypothetical protein BU23DRAFT_563445 [Bimuria novae-zelandiae CBS 107.79]|uniref:Ubiquitin-like domain-containing protein n=1 Tax=Bimuria novae-zelandiae CBS 107.79 TaxID=1447943 RepID=A0A6A5VR10_9PLEO|nr:hypothetical protein BU23DRAFT_563445 [Bimuria novae-zelandiae CBS 107.79]